MRGFGQLDPPDTGSIRSDLYELARARVDVLKRTRTQLLMPRLMAEAGSDSDLHALILTVFANPARDVVIRALRRGVERGELREDVDVELLTDLLAGLTVYRLLYSRGELRGLAARIEAAIDVLLDGSAGRPNPRQSCSSTIEAAGATVAVRRTRSARPATSASDTCLSTSAPRRGGRSATGSSRSLEGEAWRLALSASSRAGRSTYSVSPVSNCWRSRRTWHLSGSPSAAASSEKACSGRTPRSTGGESTT